MTDNLVTGRSATGAADSPTADNIDRPTAEALGGRVMAAAADLARQEAVFLELVGRFDACNAVQYWDGVQSTAHWVSWACSIAVSTAREHVRVARALRTMPVTRAAFAAGQLTYSKVREVTRLVDRLDRVLPQCPERSDQSVESAPSSPTPSSPTPSADTGAEAEESLVSLARNSTASQLARTVSSFRSLDGTSRRRRERQRVAWVVRDDGNIQLTMVLPPETGTALINAIQAAAVPPEIPQAGDEVPNDREPDNDDGQRQSADQVRAAACERSRIEAIAEIANHYLGSLPEDRSGEDHNLVVLEVSLDAFQASRSTAPDATSTADTDTSAPTSTAGDSTARSPKDVPAGTPNHNVPGGTPTDDTGEDIVGSLPPVCRIRGGAAVDLSTAQRILCDAPVVGMIIDRYGEPLAVGRKQRLATRAQRRALMVRDGGCAYPGCLRRRRLQAHHRRSWLNGGATDLDNLILLCPWHHTCVHERGITIDRCAEPSCPIGFRFTRPDGTTIVPLVAGRDERHPWQPLAGTTGETPTGDALERARTRNREQAADYEKRQSALTEQASFIEARYAHIDHDRHPEARDVFPPGGGEGYRLANCIEVMFGLTIADEDARPDAA